MDLRSAADREPVERALYQFMGAHHGLIDHQTALGLGASADMIGDRVARGLWLPVHRGIYRSAAAPSSREQELLAAVLASGEDAVASHGSAAWLWGLLAVPPDLPEVTVPYDHAPSHRGIHRHRSTDLVGTSLSQRKGIVVTGPARTILDASGVLPPHVVDVVIDRAVATKLLTVPALTAALDRYGRRGRRGAGKLRAALEARGVSAPNRTPSVLESAMARLIRAAGIAPPIAEYPVAGGRFRFDQAWPEITLAAEVNGWLAHSAYSDWQRDHEKRNWAAANDWEIAEFTWDDVMKRPERVASHLLQRIAKRTLSQRQL